MSSYYLLSFILLQDIVPSVLWVLAGCAGGGRGGARLHPPPPRYRGRGGVPLPGQHSCLHWGNKSFFKKYLLFGRSERWRQFEIQKYFQNTLSEISLEKYLANVILYLLCSHVTFLQALIFIYLVAVVWLVKRQIHQVGEEEEDRIVMIDKKGNTDIKPLEKVLYDEKEILM